jgi:hypothetical protein
MRNEPYLPFTLAPRQQGHLVQLGRWMPFRHASRVLEDLLGVSVSPETARRLCEAVGKQVEDQQTAQAHEPWKEETNAPENPSRLAISADGAMVPLTGGAWAEVRTLAIGTVPTGSADAEQVHVGELSYFSRLTEAADFTELAEVETRRRQLVQAKEVCAVMDGADALAGIGGHPSRGCATHARFSTCGRTSQPALGSLKRSGARVSGKDA